MVTPQHYRVEYTINPYMDPSRPVNHKLAQRQWEDLKHTIEAAGGEVELLTNAPPDCPDMVYAMNLGYAMVASDGSRDVLISRMRYPERQGESEAATEWFAARGYRLHEIEPGPEYYLESGDMFPWNGQVISGTGPRTAPQALRYLAEASASEVVALESVDAKAYHLDLSFCPLTAEAALLYPGAFSSESLTTLLSRVAQPIFLKDEEALGHFSANSIVVKDTIIMPARTSARLQKLLSTELGLTVALVDVSEFEKGGGSVRCMTNPLDLPRGDSSILSN